MLEVLMASMLLATVLSSLAGAAVLYEQSLQKYGARAAARDFARAELERCLAEGFERVEDYADNSPVTHELVWKVDGAEQRVEYTCEITVEIPKDTVELKNVVVRVTYPERGDGTGEFTLADSVFWSE